MLVNKRIKDLAAFVAKDVSRAQLQKVLITKDEIVATDGHVLAIMPVDTGLDDQDYPAGPEIDTTLEKQITLTTDQINTALSILPKKPTLPMLENIQIGTADGVPVINAGFPVIQIPGDKNVDNESYPNYKQVIPEYDTGNSIKLQVNGAFLKQIAALVVKYDKIPKRLLLTIPTENQHVKTAVLWEVKEDDEIRFHGLIMPLRIRD